MNVDERGNELPDPEGDTAAPDRSDAVPPPGGGWQMPQPKFQQTSGYLPQGYIDQIGVAGAAPSGAAAVAPALAPPTAGTAAVEAQPDLTEQLEPPPQPTAAAPVVKERSAGTRAAMIIVGLIGMVAFLVLFLGVIYYLFLAPPGTGTQF